MLPAQRFGEELAHAAARERRFSGELRLGLFYDSNVAVVPNASSDLVAQVLRQDQTDRGSPGELGSLSLSYTWLKTLEWEGTVGYRFLQTFNNALPDFNVQSHTPILGLVYRDSLLNKPYFAGVQFAYNFIALDGDGFVQRGIVNPYYSLFMSPSHLTTFEAHVQVKDFFEAEDIVPEEVRDGINYLIGATHYILLSEGRHFLKAGYRFDDDAAEGRNWEYSGHQFLLGAQYTLPWQDVRLRYELDYHHRFYSHRNSLISVEAPGTIRRRDREAIHLFSVAKDFVLKSQHFTASLEYLFDHNDSNLAPYDYDRHVVTSSLTWRF